MKSLVAPADVATKTYTELVALVYAHMGIATLLYI